MAAFSTFLLASLELLELEAPASYREVHDRLGGRRVAIAVDGESVAVTPRGGRLEPSASGGPVAAHAAASRAVLVRLLEGELDLTRAIVNEDVELVGALDDLTAFYEGLLAYFMGAVRCPSFPRLLGRFLTDGASEAAVVLH